MWCWWHILKISHDALNIYLSTPLLFSPCIYTPVLHVINFYLLSPVGCVYPWSQEMFRFRVTCIGASSLCNTKRLDAAVLSRSKYPFLTSFQDSRWWFVSILIMKPFLKFLLTYNRSNKCVMWKMLLMSFILRFIWPISAHYFVFVPYFTVLLPFHCSHQIHPKPDTHFIRYIFIHSFIYALLHTLAVESVPD